MGVARSRASNPDCLPVDCFSHSNSISSIVVLQDRDNIKSIDIQSVWDPRKALVTTIQTDSIYNKKKLHFFFIDIIQGFIVEFTFFEITVAVSSYLELPKLYPIRPSPEILGHMDMYDFHSKILTRLVESDVD